MSDSREKPKKSKSIKSFLLSAKKLITRVPKKDWAVEIDEDIQRLRSFRCDMHAYLMHHKRIFV